MQLQSIAEQITLKLHYKDCLNLTVILNELNNTNNTKVYFSHKNLTNGTLRTIKYKNTFIEYLIFPDGCICPSTYHRFPKYCCRKVEVFADKIEGGPETNSYLNKDNLGYYVNDLIVDYVPYWTKLYGDNYTDNPIDKLQQQIIN